MDLHATQPLLPVLSTPAATGKDPLTSHPASPAAASPTADPPPPVGGNPQPQVRDDGDTERAIAELVQRFLQSSTRNLEFRVEQQSGTPVIIVRDADGQVVRQIPSEEALRLMRHLNAQSGTLFDGLA
jgi:flagellar protein FlaG